MSHEINKMSTTMQQINVFVTFKSSPKLCPIPHYMTLTKVITIITHKFRRPGSQNTTNITRRKQFQSYTIYIHTCSLIR